jgi:MATE family multidrug resistance protein
MGILFISRNAFAKLFSDDPCVVELTAQVMPYVALSRVTDGLNGSCSDCLRGMGRHKAGAAINLISYYLIALPLGIWLSRHGSGFVGL